MKTSLQAYLTQRPILTKQRLSVCLAETLAKTPHSQTIHKVNPIPSLTHPSSTHPPPRFAPAQLQQSDSGAWAEGVPIQVSFWG